MPIISSVRELCRIVPHSIAPIQIRGARPAQLISIRLMSIYDLGVTIRAMTERAEICWLAPPSRLRRVAKRTAGRDDFEGVRWVVDFGVFDVHFRMAENLIMVRSWNIT
jgi:hypothetical protein